jgi:hypothetical protein
LVRTHTNQSNDGSNHDARTKRSIHHSPNWGHIHTQPDDLSSSGEKCSENSFVSGAGSRFFP